MTDIGSEAERLSRITEDLLRLTRLDSGAAAEPAPVAVAPVLRRVVRMLAVVAREQETTLSYEADESAVVLATGAVFSVKAVILATGTYLAGRTIVGECVEESGPDGMHAAGRLTDSLLKLGLPLRRFKTGTPPRVNARSVDFDEMELQPGDALPVPFSYGTQSPPENRAVCWLTWTHLLRRHRGGGPPLLPLL